MSTSVGQVCAKPWSVAVTSVTVPVTPDSVIAEGYGVDCEGAWVVASLIAIGVAFENVTAWAEVASVNDAAAAHNSRPVGRRKPCMRVLQLRGGASDPNEFPRWKRTLPPPA